LPGVTDSFHVPFLRIFVSSFAWSLILKNALLSVLGAVDRRIVHMAWIAKHVSIYA